LLGDTLKRMDREQTATLQSALLCGTVEVPTDPDANRSAGLHSYHVDLGLRLCHEGLVELARRRSDLSVHLQDVVVQGIRPRLSSA
jgi:hypothetical protein